MSDRPEDQSGTAEEVTEATAAWPEAEEAPAWSQLADQSEPLADSGEPAREQEESPYPGSDDAQSATPADAQPATEAGRSRRPTSLRDQYIGESDSVPRRKLSAPAFPSAPQVPGSRVTPPVSEPAETGSQGDGPSTGRGPRVPNPASLLGKLPKDKLPTDKISMDKLPLDRLSADRPLVRLRALTKQRPEVGLGIAFAGGLVIATILKRLGRR